MIFLGLQLTLDQAHPIPYLLKAGLCEQGMELKQYCDVRRQHGAAQLLKQMRLTSSTCQMAMPSANMQAPQMAFSMMRAISMSLARTGSCESA